MNRSALALSLAILLCLAQGAAFADTFRLRTGETKRGRVLAEDEQTILLDPGFNRPLTEIPKDSIAIYDREPASDVKLGGVSFYSTSPKKKARRRLEPTTDPFGAPSASEAPSAPAKSAEDKSDSGSITLEILETLFQKQLDKNPKLREWLEKAAEKSLQQSADLDKMVEAAKQD